MSDSLKQHKEPPSRHRYLQWVVAITVGVVLSFVVFERTTDPEPARQKEIEEAVVFESRMLLISYVLPGGELQVVDPLAPDRKVGKSYIGPEGDGWEVSGYYRRDVRDPWHPYLITLDASSALISLAVKDRNERLIGMSAQDPRFSAVP
jgi:hypothetical protein